MGILKSHIRLIARQAKRYQIKGDALVVGQQAVYATLSEAKEILKEQACTLPDDFDTRNKIPAWKGNWSDRNTNCQTIMALFGARRTKTCDISDYECADIIINLNNKVNKQFHNKFDTIVDSGTIEHVFDIAQGMENLSSMLKVGGTLIMAAPANLINHGFYSISPTFFYDYLIANGYSNIEIFVIKGHSNIEKKSATYEVIAPWGQFPTVQNCNYETIVFAKKQRTVKPVRNIFQGAYTRIWKCKDENRRMGQLHSLGRSLKRIIPAEIYKFIPDELYQLRQYLDNKRYYRYIGKY